jgi:hypothetical protein
MRRNTFLVTAWLLGVAALHANDVVFVPPGGGVSQSNYAGPPIPKEAVTPPTTPPVVPPDLVAPPVATVPLARPQIVGVPGPGCSSCQSGQSLKVFSPGGLFGSWRGGFGYSSACGGHHLISRPGATCSPGCSSCAAGCSSCAAGQGTCGQCGQGGQCANGKCGHSGEYLGRIKAWFHYHDTGNCAKGCDCAHCGYPLYLYFLHDCAYRNGCGCGAGHSDSEGAVNPPYSRSIFPTGHMIGAMPTGLPGAGTLPGPAPCCGGFR